MEYFFMEYKIAILGATGLVGRKVLEMLEQYNLLDNEYFLFASKKSAKSYLKIGNKNYQVEEICKRNLLAKKFDFALFCTPESVSAQYVPKLAQNGTVVIDFSSLFRKDYPLIVPEINMEQAKGNIICNPNCSTAIGVMALFEIHKKYGLKSIVYSTYQALSGAGKNALLDQNVTKKEDLRKLEYVIDNNLIPCIGEMDKNGNSREESKMIFETKKILNDFQILVSATCVRVNVDVCHCESITFTTKNNATIYDIENALKNTKNVVYVINDISKLMPNYVKDKKEVFVGRLRQSETNKNTFSIFVVGDNLRKGAGQNGVQILEQLIKGNL